MTLHCTNCHGNRLKLIDQFTREEVIDIYQNDLLLAPGIDVSDDIDRDIELHECDACKVKLFTAITGTENFYNKLLEFDWYYKPEKAEFLVTRKYIKPHDQVLEIGAGSGYYSHWITNYTGLEFNPKAVEQARAKGINMLNESIEQHAEQHAMKYDVVVAHQVLEHVADIYSFVDASIRATQPSGTIIYSVPNDDGFLGTTRNYSLNMPPHHVSKWTKQALTTLAEIHGLELRALIEEPIRAFHREHFRAQTDIGHTVTAVYERK